MAEWTEDIIPVERAGTLAGLLRERVRRTPDAVAYRYYDRRAEAWLELTWAETAARVARWRAALAAEGLRPGDRVAVALRNGPDWVAFDQAALGLRLVVVPLYVDDRIDNTAYVLRDAACSLVLLADGGQWDGLRANLQDGDPLERAVLLSPRGAGREALDDPRVRLLDQWLPADGASAPEIARADPHELATIVYTSGTSGRPKGVMLSHYNILANAHGALTHLDIYQQDILLSILPLSHSFERTCGYYLLMMAGATVAYSRSIPQLAEDMKEIRPTAMMAVPRVFERVHTRLRQQLHKRGRVARALFRLTVAVGWRRFNISQRRARWGPDQLLWPPLDRLVARPVRERFGGRLRLAVSGGAALTPEVAREFLGLGLVVVQGYGLTEASPIVAANRPGDNVPASIGVPLRGIEVRLGDNAELLVQSPSVMQGYWNNHAATAQAIDSDGWLHTGDQARMDDTGHLYITGRIKDIVVMSNGEKVSPSDMELAIALDPLFEQAMVVGEGKPYLGALLVIDSEQWFGLAQDLGLDAFDEKSLRDPRLHNHVIKRLRHLLRDFPGYAKIRRVWLTLEPWTIENGLLTPTMKLKREKVAEEHARALAELYAEPDRPSRGAARAR